MIRLISVFFALLGLSSIVAAQIVGPLGGYSGARSPGFRVTGPNSSGGGASGPPAVSSLSPTSGTTAGGTPVVIFGSNFQGVTAVSFGGTPAASFTYVNPGTIDATSPVHAAATVDVQVTTPLGTSPTNPGDQFTFVAPPSCSNKMDFTQSCNSQYIGAF